MSKTFVVEIEVSDYTHESTFGTAMVKGLQDGDIHSLSYLHHQISNVHVRPYEAPDREWAVVIDGKDGQFEWGFKGQEKDAIDAARKAYPDYPIVGTYAKEV